MARERLQYVSYYYRINLLCEITYPDGVVTPRNLANFTTSIELDFNYAEARFPYLTLALSLRRDEYFFFQNNYKEAPVYFTLERGYRISFEPELCRYRPWAARRPPR